MKIITPCVTSQEELLRDILFKKVDVSQAPFIRNGLAHYRRGKKGPHLRFLDGLDGTVPKRPYSLEEKGHAGGRLW